MKMRRFTSAGIIAVKDFLADIKASGQLDLVRRDQLLIGPLTEPIPALADLDLDTARIFDTTFAFCEYFHSLIKDRMPLSYRTDVGFWTWLAMVYLGQLVKSRRGRVDVGDLTRYIPAPESYRDYYRHLLAGAFQIYEQYNLIGNPGICKTLLWKALDTYGDVYEQIASRQWMVQNPAIVDSLNKLYFDNGKMKLKPNSGGPCPGAARRLVVAIDQLGMTRDFYEIEDASELIRILPKEFDRFKV